MPCYISLRSFIGPRAAAGSDLAEHPAPDARLNLLPLAWPAVLDGDPSVFPFVSSSPEHLCGRRRVHLRADEYLAAIPIVPDDAPSEGDAAAFAQIDAFRMKVADDRRPVRNGQFRG